MNIKKQFLDYINEVKSIISPLCISDNKLSEIQTSIQNAELIVPVVGGFSAGKSTLINSFLGEEILPTAVTPETALATELRYSKTEYIEAVTAAGSVDKYELSEFPKLKDNARNFKNLRVYLNNENLEAIQPLVLVDMPGFDAPIENHNQAILTYLERGVFFVFLTSVEDGNITLSMRREIENLERFSKGFTFCLSKTNLRAPSDVVAVKEKVAEQLEDDFDYIDEIVLLDREGGSNLQNILNAIDPEKLFRAMFIDILRDNYTALIQSINLKISTFKGSKQSAQDTVIALQNAIDKLLHQKETALSEMETRYSANKINMIVEKVGQVLSARKVQLVELALQNRNMFANEINDLVKNTLLSEIQQSFQSIGQDVMSNFSSNVRIALSQDNLLLDSSIVERIQAGAETLINSAFSGLQSLTESMSRKKTGTNVYRSVATILSVTTSVVTPILEVVLIFLPDIIAFFAKKAQEKRMKEQAEEQIIYEVIPQIKAKVSEELPKTFNENVSTLINQISEQF